MVSSKSYYFVGFFREMYGAAFRQTRVLSFYNIIYGFLLNISSTNLFFWERHVSKYRGNVNANSHLYRGFHEKGILSYMCALGIDR